MTDELSDREGVDRLTRVIDCLGDQSSQWGTEGSERE